MKFFIGVTDFNWYRFLSELSPRPEDVNFWQPGGQMAFKALSPGAPFLFKLKHPYNAIGGVGFFTSHTFLPISLAWETFEERNGMVGYDVFSDTIGRLRNRGNSLSGNPNIGCIVLSNPLFFPREDWIPIPEDWKRNIVQGKAYSTDEPIGAELWKKVEMVLEKNKFYQQSEGLTESQFLLEESESPMYREMVLSRIRLGQGAFRTLIINAYSRKCAISGEKTLPVLEAAHIKPYVKSGPHVISNGLLLRSDLHKLFDQGYITVTNDYKVEVSRRIREEFENGKDYYKFHGNELLNLPTRSIDKPAAQFLDWHNGIFKG